MMKDINIIPAELLPSETDFGTCPPNLDLLAVKIMLERSTEALKTFGLRKMRSISNAKSGGAVAVSAITGIVGN